MAESQPINVPEDVALNAAFIYENPHVWETFAQFVATVREMTPTSPSTSLAVIEVPNPIIPRVAETEMPPLLAAMLAENRLKPSQVARPSGISGPSGTSGPSGISGPSGTAGPSGTPSAPSGAFTTASRDASPSPSARSVAATKRPGSALSSSSDEEVLPEASCDDDFIPVVHRKKKKSKARQILSATPSPAASDSEANHATAISRRASTETLCPSTSAMDVSAPRSPRSPRSANPPPPPPSPPPSPSASRKNKNKVSRLYLMVPKDASLPGILTNIEKAGIRTSWNEWHRLKKMHMIQPKTVDDHRALTAYLDGEKIPYQSDPLPEDKRIRRVIRGIPVIMTTDEVMTGLDEKGITALEVHRMHRSARFYANNPHLGREYDMVLVILDTNEDVKLLYSIKDISGLGGFKVEEPNRKSVVVQCHNCQRYGHTSRGCRLPSRCVKCAGLHHTKQCHRPKDITLCTEPPSCVMCETSGHTASYRGCVKAPKRPSATPKTSKTSKAPKATPTKEAEFRLAPTPTKNAWFPSESPAVLPQATSGVSPSAAAPVPTSPSTNPTPISAPVKATDPPKSVPQASVTVTATAPVVQAAPVPTTRAVVPPPSDDIWATVRALTSVETMEFHSRLADCCLRLRQLGYPDPTILFEINDIQCRLRQHTLNVVFGSTSSP